LHPTHDSGPLWLASPLTYDSFIHYNLPVYPGAPGTGSAFLEVTGVLVVDLQLSVLQQRGQGPPC
ncbi:MAG: hypothetical protein ACR2G5_11290, partial [Pyrinomonadaceae bacterium]